MISLLEPGAAAAIPAAVIANCQSDEAIVLRVKLVVPEQVVSPPGWFKVAPAPATAALVTVT